MQDSRHRSPTAIELHRFPGDGTIPNNAALALIVYRGAFASAPDIAAACETRFAANRWGDGWRDGIYDYHHYHSTAHEALGIAAGSASVRFGGDGGSTVIVRAGDVVVIPAGVGHKLVDGTPDLLVVGAYPDGQQPDLQTADPGRHDASARRIAAVPLPTADPLHGPDGPLIRHWRG